MTGAALGNGLLNLAAENSNEHTGKPVRLGVIGLGPRGKFLLSHLISYQSGVTISALCELDPARLEEGIAIVKKATGAAPVGYCKGEYEYRNMLQRDDLDGVVVATGVQVLARIAVDAMKAGKHVSVEVNGPYSLDDCWAIVEEKERSGKHFMLLEQCCYGDVNLMILNMLKHGLFGEPYYAE
ncbi:MAG TPA: hypothetical protein PK777_13590, partial [Thermoguttaceae bacterium]|nr:hypothetical protein [Thermoguttaceae bacterium]